MPRAEARDGACHCLFVPGLVPGVWRARRLLLPAILASLVFLAGCGPMLVAGATYGGAVLHERRSAATVLADQTIEVQAVRLYFQNPDVRDHSNISVTSYNFEVLLTGQAATDAVARRFAQLVAGLPRVTRVYNEVVTGPNASFSRRSQDTLLGSRAKIALADIPLQGFDPLRVKIVVEDGVVFLMGLLTPAEAEATVEKIRRIPGVVRVVRIFNIIHDTPKPA